jgi:DNA primase
MALPPQFLDELRARTPLPALIGRRVRLARSGRQWKGCCPFHGEKTPSFYVYDDHYHCFGCGAHGDAITFAMQSNGTSFPEAIEQLAAEAGMQVPAQSPEAQAAERRRVDLGSVLEMAAAGFQRRLFLPDGKQARDYLTRRGLSEDTIRRYGLGWSGEGRGAIAADLGREGVTQEQLIDAGLMRRDDETARVYDLFFSRVMFPIRDRRGRTISFGGRTLGDGQPKYLNGPETELFAKRRTLYGLDLAREAVRHGATLVVVEGYMDVIALGQAGFGAAVAPLGTALTEEQLGELWRLSPTPVLCFDGDAAGGRAAARAADLALPMLAPERTLKLIALPTGEDPDSLVRSHGAPAFQTMLDSARPLADCLYDLLREATGAATPEQRATLRNRLEEAAKRIPDKALASEYRGALLDRFFASRRRGPSRGASDSKPVGRPRSNVVTVTAERNRFLTAILLRHPMLLRDVEHAWCGLELEPSLAQLRDVVTTWANHAEVLDSQALIAHLGSFGMTQEVERILAETDVSLPACASSSAMPAEAVEGWWHFFGFLNLDGLREELELARQQMAAELTDESQRKVKVLKETLLKESAGDPQGAEIAA